MILLRPRLRIIPNARHLGSFFAVRSASSGNGPRRRASRSHVLGALLPDRLRPSDLLDLSGYKKKCVKPFVGGQEPTVIEYFRSGSESTRFPHATKGFLYYHRPEPQAPLFACSVRFRICETPKAFSAGSDLLLQDGKPWEKGMRWMIQAGWADLLAARGFICQKELDVCRPFATPDGTIIRTLRPEELLPNDLADLSGIRHRKMKLCTDDQEGAELCYYHSRGLTINFPPQSNGFLYFHRPDLHAPLLACSVRFRICDSPDTFNTGKDLLLPDGSPWRKSMAWMIHYGWADLLAERNVISKARLEKYWPFLSTYDPRKRHICVHAFHQTFPMTITASTTRYIHFNVIGEESAVSLTIRGLPAFRRYLHNKVGHGMEEDLTLKLHIEPNGTLQVSETAPPPYDEFLWKGMAPPHLYITRPASRLPNEKSDPIGDALDILREHEKRSLGAS